MSIANKLFNIQARTLDLRKDSTNPHFKNTYASLGAVLDLLVPVLNEEKIVMTQGCEVLNEGGFVLATRLFDTEEDVEGEREFVTYTPLVLDKENMQGLGSAITYARRYALVSLFGLDAEDDDGNEASKKRDVKTDPPRRAPVRR
jgi:hypothetical protein